MELPGLVTVEVEPGRPEDLDRFDDFIRHHPKGDVLQTSTWGELKARTGWIPVRYLVIEETSGRPRGAVSVLLRRLPIPGLELFLAYAPRGPVIDFGDEEALGELVRTVSRLLLRRGAVALKIDPDIPAPDPEVVGRLRRLGFRPVERGRGFESVQPRFVMRLPLTGTPEEVFARFHPKTRYNIRLAERRGVTVRVGRSMDDLRTFYRILLETARRDRFLVRGFSYYEDIWRLLVGRDLARLFLADHDGETLAGTIAFVLGDKAWYVYGASSNLRREVMPNHLLQWTMIRWAMERGCRLYDFRGVSGNLDPGDPLYGLYRFKKGFGAELTEFIGEFDLVLRPLWYHAYAFAEPLYRGLRSRLRGGGAGGEPAGEGV